MSYQVLNKNLEFWDILKFKSKVFQNISFSFSISADIFKGQFNRLKFYIIIYY